MRFARLALGVVFGVVVMTPGLHAGATTTTDCPARISTSVTLTSDMVCTGSDGIVVTGVNITIDLGGHTLIGDHTAGNYGVYMAPAITDVTIANGTIQGFQTGIMSFGTNIHVQNVRVLGNSATGASDQAGIFINGDGARLTNVLAAGNAGDGVVIHGSSAVLRSVEAIDNKILGVYLANSGGRVTASRLFGNGRGGLSLAGDGGAIVGRLPGRPASDENLADGNGFENWTADGSGAGISAAYTTTPPKGKNEASGNDDPTECDPAALC